MARLLCSSYADRETSSQQRRFAPEEPNMYRPVCVAAACLIALTTTFARGGVASSGGSAVGGNPSVADVLESVLYGDASVLNAFLELPIASSCLATTPQNL